MFRQGDSVRHLQIDYWLPITKVNVTGTVVKATSSHGKATESSGEPTAGATDTDETQVPSKATPAVVSVVTRPDYSQGIRLSVPAGDWLERHANLGLLPDGRLSSADTSTQDDRGQGVKAALSLAALGAGAGAFAGPLGAAIGAGAGLALGAGLAVGGDHREAVPRLSVMAEKPSGDSPGSTAEPAHDKLKILNIKSGYVRHDHGEAQLLADLRTGEAQARLAFAAAAHDSDTAGTDASLGALAQRLKLIRAELARSEALYQKWLDDHVTTTSTAYDEELEIGALPASANAREWLENPPERIAGPFHEACTALGIVVSCDFTEVHYYADTDGEAPADDDSDVPAADGSICYRLLRPAVLRVFAGSKNGGSLEERSTQRILVAMPGYERSVPAFDVREKQALSLSFDDTGALTSVSSDLTGGAANTASEVGDLPTGLKDAFDAGTDIAAPFTPAGHAKAMKDQLDEINARAALSPAADPLKSLKDQVAKAELQARLKVAGQLASGEASNAVVILGSAAQSGS
jgi:hypothetical protein